RDGEHLISGNQDTVWKRLAVAMGRPELADDERYATHNARGANQAELDDLIAEWSKGLTSAELEELLNDHSVPNGKIYTAPDMLADAHFAARQAIVTMAHPQLGDFPMQNVVPKLSDTPGEVRWVGPELGEHTDEVLEQVLGLDDGARRALRDAGVI
ncbi:MAG: CoA transferase, partial [Acidimicrobiia bacterium]